MARLAPKRRTVEPNVRPAWRSGFDAMNAGSMRIAATRFFGVWPLASLDPPAACEPDEGDDGAQAEPQIAKRTPIPTTRFSLILSTPPSMFLPRDRRCPLGLRSLS